MFNISNFLADFIKEDTRFYYLSLIKESEYSETPWSIHGLWPQTDPNNYPSYCKNIPFSLDALKPLIPELNIYWYSNNDDNPDFWKHEYLKHGSCMYKSMSEFDYFHLTLKLYHQAVSLKLPDKHYNPTTKKCLIPINLDFTFRNN